MISCWFLSVETKLPQKEKKEGIMEILTELYQQAEQEDNHNILTQITYIIKKLGEHGYVAIDSKNQITMTNTKQVMQFCEMVDRKKEATLTIIEITYNGGFVEYQLDTKDGKVKVLKSHYEYNNETIKKVASNKYMAEYWNYTEEGYLMFSGAWFSEELYVLTLSVEEEFTAFRVEPLDERCKELNRKYLLPIGYEKNNMFLVDWSEDDFGKLNFYDLYDIFYRCIYTESVPYLSDENLSIGTIYHIPKQEFEDVIMKYIHIDSKTLQSKTNYIAEDLVYEYKPRGFYEVEYPQYPYSEVINFTKNQDGTITLLANVVFPNSGNSKVYTHEVVVRPLENGAVQYVSNHVIDSENDWEATWYTPRLTQEEWEKFYGDMEQKNAEVLFSKHEQQCLNDLALQVADMVKFLYKNIQDINDSVYTSNILDFSKEQVKKAVKLLGKDGFTSVSENVNMEHPKVIEEFYHKYLNKEDTEFTIYEVYTNGLIGATTFRYRQNKIQTYYVGIAWNENGEPMLRDTLVSDVAELKLTEKGYFIYTYEIIPAHASLRQYWRIAPLSDRCRELTEIYVSGLSYVNYNMLVTNWDNRNVETILMRCMFEDIYRIATGENLKVSNQQIPAELYEEIMTTYFPVTVEQLRKYCGYNNESNSYQYERISASPYPPFGEVVDYVEHTDGTITLFVDGVWADYNSDYAFTNKIVVQPLEDGKFRYLSNIIEEKELKLPPIARRKNLLSCIRSSTL